jgi:hypothetical protein
LARIRPAMVVHLPTFRAVGAVGGGYRRQALVGDQDDANHGFDGALAQTVDGLANLRLKLVGHFDDTVGIAS